MNRANLGNQPIGYFRKDKVLLLRLGHKRHCRFLMVFFELLYVVIVQLLSHVWLFETPWTAALQASLSITNSWSLLKLMSIKLVMPSNHLTLCRTLLLVPSIFPSIRGFSNELALHIRWPKYWSFSFSISTSNEYSGLMNCLLRGEMTVMKLFKKLKKGSIWEETEAFWKKPASTFRHVSESPVSTNELGFSPGLQMTVAVADVLTVTTGEFLRQNLSWAAAKLLTCRNCEV